jgi:DNA-directed RNA polymerase subunit RPC12/RpoP
VNEISNLIKRNDVQNLLRSIRDKKIDIIEPFIENDEIIYPKLDEIGIPKEDQEEILRALSDIGILSKEARDAIIACPTCGSRKLRIHLRCPSCRSLELRRGAIVEHLACGHLDLEENFKKGEQLRCPKCGRVLRALGVDYRRPGILYRCMSCGDIFQNPSTTYTCESGDSFTEDEAKITLVSAYKPSEEARPLLERSLIDFEEMLGDLPGWRIKAPAIFKDPSGIEHEFTFAAWILEGGLEEGPPFVIGMMEVSEREVATNALLAFRGKIIDIPARVKLLIAMPKLDKDALLLAERYGISVIEAEDGDELAERLKRKLQSITMERENLRSEAQALEEILKEIDVKEETKEELQEISVMKDKSELSEGIGKVILKLAKKKRKDEL